MKTTHNKKDLIPASGTKKKSVTPKRTAKKISSAKSTTAKNEIGTNVKAAPKKVACGTKQAEMKSSSIAHRAARRISNISDPRVARFSRTSGGTSDEGKGDITKRKVKTGATTSAVSNQFLSSNTSKGNNMKLFKEFTSRQGKIGYILAWAIGIPVPLLIIVFLLRGCN